MSERVAYIATKSCGCLCGAVMALPHPGTAQSATERTREIAETVAQWEMSGLTIDIRQAEQVRTSPWRCAEHARQL